MVIIQTQGGVGQVQLATALVILPLAAEVKSSIPVLITLRGVLFTPMLYRVRTAMHSCISGVLNASGLYITPVIKVIAS